jgi:hypothetical protein
MKTGCDIGPWREPWITFASALFPDFDPGKNHLSGIDGRYDLCQAAVLGESCGARMRDGLCPRLQGRLRQHSKQLFPEQRHSSRVPDDCLIDSSKAVGEYYGSDTGTGKHERCQLQVISGGVQADTTNAWLNGRREYLLSNTTGSNPD